MTPAVVPLSPGAYPTDPGWYVVLMYGEPYRPRTACILSDPENYEFPVKVDGWNMSCRIADLTFIARIHPDRIEGRE